MNALTRSVARAGVFLLYAALCVACAAAAELAVELLGFDGERQSGVASDRHFLLALATMSGAAYVGAAVCGIVRGSSGSRDALRRLRLELDRLPCHGRGWRFVVVTGALQLALGVAAQFGEPTVFSGPNAVSWIVTALVVVIVAALTARFVVCTLPTIAGLCFVLLAAPQAPSVPSRRRQARRAIAGSASWPRELFNRPPPITLLA